MEKKKKARQACFYRSRFMALLFFGCLPLLNKYFSFTLPPPRALNIIFQFLSQRKLKVPVTPPEIEKAKVLCRRGAALRRGCVGLSGPKYPMKGVEEQIEQLQPATGEDVIRLRGTGALASWASSSALQYYGLSP